VTDPKNRWGGLTGPSYWRCMNQECISYRQLQRRDFAARFESCKGCGRALYRSRPEKDEDQ